MPKQIIIIIISMLLLIGCTTNSYKEEKELYNHFINDLMKAKLEDFSDDLPFNLNVYFDKVSDSEITYRIIIDEPKIIMNNIKVIAIHDQKTNDIFPTIGIFDQPLNLIPGDIDLTLNKVGGIILVGYIPYQGKLEDFKCNIKVLLEFEDESSHLNRLFYLFHK